MNGITSSQRRVMIVTGEASGDLHAAKLMQAVRQQASDIEFFGIGGKEMAAEGCDILFPIELLSVMGFAEVAVHLPRILSIFNKLKAVLHGQQKPDVLVLIDSPEFNLRLAKEAKRAGVKVLYYVSPQVWAWRRGRVRKIAAVVDKLAVIFPFEPELYAGLDIDVRYVGHPLLDDFETMRQPDEQPVFLQGEPGSKTVGLFPGSRQNELKYMLQTLLEAARILVAKKTDVRFLVPIASALVHEDVAGSFPADLPVTFVTAEQANIYEVAAACDAIITVSGTVTLQIALAGTPMAIIYKLSPFSYMIGKYLINVDYIGLVNIVARKQIVREFIQNDAKPAKIAEEILLILDDLEYNASIRNELVAVKKELGKPGCSKRVAVMMLELLARK